jgi:hypothetical protein
MSLRTDSNRLGVTLAALVFSVACNSSALDSRGVQFIGFSSFERFTRTLGNGSSETVFLSRVIQSRIEGDELIASWNVRCPAAAYLKVEARAIYSDRQTKYYQLGLWSSDTSKFPRESVLNQKNEDGDVATDTLILTKPCRQFQIRLTLGAGGDAKPELRFLGLSLLNRKTAPPPLPPNRVAWDKVLPVPERSQMAYTGGGVWCSPTTVSMLLGFWSHRLNRPELDKEVPQIVGAIYDANWEGTGNWPFNTAFAGSFEGMRAYVTRMTDVSELEDWIERGIPVGLSVCYDRLRGKTSGPNGHLVVCVGFTKDGDVVLNDPGTSRNVRKVFPRKNLIHAWAYSKNAAYLVYPEKASPPRDRFGHWDSPTSRQQVAFTGISR